MKHKILRHLYSAVLYLAVPFIMIRLWWRSRKQIAYKNRWAERFGFFQKPGKSESIWLHAVSFGEAAAAEPLIKNLLQQYPEKNIVVTTMTPTGSERVIKAFGEKVFHIYVPYDTPSAVNRFLKNINPCMAIIMETELWPNTLHQCVRRSIPVLLANARLSEKSARGYLRIKSLTQYMLNCISMVAAQSDAAA